MLLAWWISPYLVRGLKLINRLDQLELHKEAGGRNLNGYLARCWINRRDFLRLNVILSKRRRVGDSGIFVCSAR